MPTQKFSWDTSSDDAQPSVLSREYLRERAQWIRDQLDPLVARDGPDALQPDNVITLIAFFEELRQSAISIDSFRYSRIHYALLELSGRATRWPGRLIDQADEIIRHWETIHGPLLDIRPPLYEPGGRLHGLSTPEDLEREKLLIKWLRAPDAMILPSFARRHGDLGFKPGDWWINAMYAYRAGIIDNGSPAGGVTCDSNKAYALLMTHNDELASPSLNTFTYRPRPSDCGRYRLCAATLETRLPIRVLRSHTLRSFWSPRAGIRYEGLFKVSGWSVTFDATLRIHNYDITFTRLSQSNSIVQQASMLVALDHPDAEGVDDYKEYKRIRREVRAARNPFTRARPLVKPILLPASTNISAHAAPENIVASQQQQYYHPHTGRHHGNDHHAKAGGHHEKVQPASRFHSQRHPHRPPNTKSHPRINVAHAYTTTTSSSTAASSASVLNPHQSRRKSSNTISSPVKSITSRRTSETGTGNGVNASKTIEEYTEGADERAARLSIDIFRMESGGGAIRRRSKSLDGGAQEDGPAVGGPSSVSKGKGKNQALEIFGLES